MRYRLIIKAEGQQIISKLRWRWPWTRPSRFDVGQDKPWPTESSTVDLMM